MVESTPTTDTSADGRPDTAFEPTPTPQDPPADALDAAPAPRRRRTARRPAAEAAAAEAAAAEASVAADAATDTAAPAAADDADATPPPRKRAARKTATKRVAKKAADTAAGEPEQAALEGAELTPTTVPEAANEATTEPATEGEAAPPRRTRKATTSRRTARKTAAAPEPPAEEPPTQEPAQTAVGEVAPDVVPAEEPASAPEQEPVVPAAEATTPEVAAPDVPGVSFQAPPAYAAEPGASEPARPRRRRSTRTAGPSGTPEQPAPTAPDAPSADITTPDTPATETPALETPALETPTAETAPSKTTPTQERPRRRRATRAQGAQTAPAGELPLPGDLEPRDLAVDEGSDLEAPTPAPVSEETPEQRDEAVEEAGAEQEAEEESAADEETPREGRRRRRRGGRGRRSRNRDVRDEESEEEAEPGDETEAAADQQSVDRESVDQESVDQEPGAKGAEAEETEPEAEDEEGGSSTRRRRRRRRRGGDEEGAAVETERPANRRERTRARREEDEVSGLRGSTRLEAKRLRRREGRELGRRRTPLLTEAEFLARRESVKRTMVVRQQGKRTQIAVLEDGMLVEHYVDSGETGTLVGSVFLGRVQNVLPSMEAAFVDLGRGRNAVLYAGEVNWDAAGLEGQPKRIELALKSGDPVLVQVTKDPIGHKGARLTSQVSLPGRFLVYVPNGSMTGISRKLPDTERSRLKAILRKVVPEHAGVIVRTAAEGASEEELAADVARLQEEWERIQQAAKTASAPALLHGEPDLTVRVLRDVFNEDFSSVVVSGDRAWNTVEPYIRGVAPELAGRVSKWTGTGDVFAANRVDEQLAKALDRKVYLPSGGSLVIDRTEAMVVIDVNTGRFTGKGGNLEETVTKNNLEAAEEIVRQLRLRDLGGIIVIDFIDMVLESNRDLVMRRLLECLGRDRTKHQVAEVSSLGLVQMTRKRVGTGLLEAFSHQCEHCKGRGVIVSLDFEAPAPEPEQLPVPSARPRALVPPGAAPSPALLGPGQVRAGANGASAPVPDDAAELVAMDPVAAEDPVEPPTSLEVEPAATVAALASPNGEYAAAGVEPSLENAAPVLQGPDPVDDMVDDGRPQRRRRRATRP